MSWENVHDVIRKKMQNHIYRMTPLLYMCKKNLFVQDSAVNVLLNWPEQLQRHMCSQILKR